MKTYTPDDLMEILIPWKRKEDFEDEISEALLDEKQQPIVMGRWPFKD